MVNQIRLTSHAPCGSSGERTNPTEDLRSLVFWVFYLMKRVSRSWSRLTKDFIVRNRMNRS